MNTLNFTSETQQLLETLEGNNYYRGDMIEFIEQYGESDFQKHYEQYVEFGEDHSYEAVDAFIESFGMNCLEDFEEAYYGSYESSADFAEDFMNSMGYEIPDFVVVDWDGTWERNLRHDFIYESGYVFNRNF